MIIVTGNHGKAGSVLQLQLLCLQPARNGLRNGEKVQTVKRSFVAWAL